MVRGPRSDAITSVSTSNLQPLTSPSNVPNALRPPTDCSSVPPISAAWLFLFLLPSPRHSWWSVKKFRRPEPCLSIFP